MDEVIQLVSPFNIDGRKVLSFANIALVSNLHVVKAARVCVTAVIAAPVKDLIEHIRPNQILKSVAQTIPQVVLGFSEVFKPQLLRELLNCWFVVGKQTVELVSIKGQRFSRILLRSPSSPPLFSCLRNAIGAQRRSILSMKSLSRST
jgi:hypothetical protein